MYKPIKSVSNTKLAIKNPPRFAVNIEIISTTTIINITIRQVIFKFRDLG
jgi:hypothetical protein